MTAKLRAQLKLPQPRPSARELLHALLKHLDVAGTTCRGDVRLVAELPPALMDQIAEWDVDEREEEGAFLEGGGP